MRRRREREHRSLRDFCRVFGPILIAVGFVMVAVGTFGFMKRPSAFPVAFIGMLILGGGIGLARVGYLGTAARFIADDAAPAARQIVAEAVRGARAAGAAEHAPRCGKCGAENDTDARFCKSCGAPVGGGRSCPACGRSNDGDAKFCDGCGAKLAGS